MEGNTVTPDSPSKPGAGKRRTPETPGNLRPWLMEMIGKAIAAPSIEDLRAIVRSTRTQISGFNGFQPDRNSYLERNNVPILTAESLILELDQILAARTIERARYYLRRMQRSTVEIKTNGVNDINLNRWKDYEEILTDSLWLFPKRDRSGPHNAWYWGNFVPQIPHQLILRFTRKGDWVLDPFAGSGTTLIEAMKLGRNSVGVELNSDIAMRTRQMVDASVPRSSKCCVVHGDSASISPSDLLRISGGLKYRLVILHPPYHDIIRFSEDPRDLSTVADVDSFIRMLGKIVDNNLEVLGDGGHIALVIGDKYQNGEIVPLGFLSMNMMLGRSLVLKSIVVKNYDATRGKRGAQDLWKYRALSGGFYLFKHEYVFIFRHQI